MNIYCVIFMCTFGANTTDTELPLRNNAIIDGPAGNGKAVGSTTLGDVASMILPEKGEPVPNMGDIVMELPKMHRDEVPIANAAASSPSSSSPSDSSAGTKSASSGKSLTLSDILLPPSARNHK